MQRTANPRTPVRFRPRPPSEDSTRSRRQLSSQRDRWLFCVFVPVTARGVSSNPRMRGATNERPFSVAYTDMLLPGLPGTNEKIRSWRPDTSATSFATRVIGEGCASPRICCRRGAQALRAREHLGNQREARMDDGSTITPCERRRFRSTSSQCSSALRHNEAAHARVAKLVNARDLKSLGRKAMSVRSRPRAPY